jgi:hypothetical protein
LLTNHNQIQKMKKLLLLALPLLMFACSSDSDSGPSETAGVAFIKGKQDGVAFNYTFNNVASDNFLYNANSGFSGEGFDRWYYYGGSLVSFTPPDFTPTFYIVWNNMFFGASGNESGETAEFYNTVSELPTNYLTEAQDDAHMPGLDIQFDGPDDVVYSSRYGSQAGSTFAISGSSEGVDSITGLKTKTVWGTFSCKVYNSDNPAEGINVANSTKS